MTNIIIRIAISTLIILCALFIGKQMIGSKEDPKSKKPPVVIPQVDTIEVAQGNYRPEVRSYGNVQSYFETTLTPQVNGRIMFVSPRFRVGQKISEGEVLATIDETDFKAALASLQANLILQERTLAEEEIRAKQAADDWKASGRNLNDASEFVLRKPQLAAAKANIDAVMATISKAEADIQRTKIVAPYNAIVTERSASVGNYATPQSMLGRLVATEKAEVRIPLTAGQMRRIQFKAEGEKTQLTLTVPSNPLVIWKAELTQMEPTVDPLNQVSYAIGTIDKPYESATSPLSVGSFVNVLLPAKEIKGAYKVTESSLVNDSFIWVVDAKDELTRVDAERIQSSDGSAFIRVTSADLKSPLRVVTRPLSTFRTGMKVDWKKEKPKSGGRSEGKRGSKQS